MYQSNQKYFTHVITYIYIYIYIYREREREREGEMTGRALRFCALQRVDN